MDKRDRHIDLGYELANVVGLSYDRIHWQPDSRTTLTYPCVLYERKTPYVTKADDKAYIIQDSYYVTHIYKNDTSIKQREMLEHFKLISIEAPTQVVDGLYHDYYTIFY